MSKTHTLRVSVGVVLESSEAINSVVAIANSKLELQAVKLGAVIAWGTYAIEVSTEYEDVSTILDTTVTAYSSVSVSVTAVTP